MRGAALELLCWSPREEPRGRTEDEVGSSDEERRIQKGEEKHYTIQPNTDTGNRVGLYELTGWVSFLTSYDRSKAGHGRPVQPISLFQSKKKKWNEIYQKDGEKKQLSVELYLELTNEDDRWYDWNLLPHLKSEVFSRNAIESV